MGKEAGLPDRQRWLQSYKVPKLPAPDNSVSSKGKTPRKADKRRKRLKKVTKKDSSVTPGKGSNPKAKTGRKSTRLLHSCPCLRLANLSTDNQPGDDTIPPHAKRVELEGGLMLFCGSRDHPLMSFEAEQQAHRQAGQQIRLWMAG